MTNICNFRRTARFHLPPTMVVSSHRRWIFQRFLHSTTVSTRLQLPTRTVMGTTSLLFRKSSQQFPTSIHHPHGQKSRSYHRTIGSCQTSVSLQEKKHEGPTLLVSSSVDQKEQTWLVVGDGDLSFCASLAEDLRKENNHNIRLLATVLEDETTHRTVYRNSRTNAERILFPGATPNGNEQRRHSVTFSVDATQLEQRFPPQSFDRIIFNFPHWRGKANNRYNRALLDDFFRSAAQVLKQPQQQQPQHQIGGTGGGTDGGEIHVALCAPQGGADATSLLAWRSSWMAHAYAAEHGLVLRRLEHFVPHCYDRSSYRGRDRSFAIGDQPLTYVFGWPVVDVNVGPQRQSTRDDDDDDAKNDPRLHIAFRHELRLLMDPALLSQCKYTPDELQHSDIIPELVRQVTPDGIGCEVPMRSLIIPNKMLFPMLVFLVVYRSTLQRPLTRSLADSIRTQLEEESLHRFGLEIEKRSRMVSKPFPYPILESLILHR